MKIKQLSYHNKATGWQLAPMEFGDLNLLVGASGVGKTQILKAILDLKRIANGESLNGVKWDITFEVDEHEHEYHWRGEFATTGTGDIDEFLDEKYKAQHRSKIVQESLLLNGTEIINSPYAVVDLLVTDLQSVTDNARICNSPGNCKLP